MADKSFSQVKGAYSVVLLLEGCLIGARDPHGFRPLCLGKLGDGYILASESCAFDLMKAEFVREINPGEIVIIKGNKLESIYLPGAKAVAHAFCVFEIFISPVRTAVFLMIIFIKSENVWGYSWPVSIL